MTGRRLSQNIELLVSTLGAEMRHADELERQILRLENDLRSVHTERLANVARAHNDASSVKRAFTGGRAAIVSWDMGHNPVGRAFVLQRLLSQDWSSVVVGPGWRRYGNGLWPPLLETGIESRVFPCRTLLDFYPRAALEATKERFDLVYVSKPRLPSLFLGFLIKEYSECPLILDIDDHELSFFENRLGADLAEVRSAGAPALMEPYEEIGTRFSENFIEHADAVTVSNIALRDRFGGSIIRHARDENAFDPARFDRASVRRELGVADDEFALIFVGTVRPHKGVLEVLQAIDEIADDKISLHIVGDGAPADLGKMLKRFERARVVQHPSWSYENLPWLLCAADCIPLLQDPDHPIAAYQIPSKISDATAVGVPVLMTDVPPLRDLRELPGLHRVRRETLKDRLLELKASKDEVDRSKIRSGFLTEFSEAVNRARLQLTIAEIKRVKPLPQLFHDVRVLMSEAIGEAAARADKSHFPIPALHQASKPRSNVVFFWKQNDTGIYGRRSDMIAKHLLLSNEVDRILFFDAPIGVAALDSLSQKANAAPQDQSALVLRNTIARLERRLDTDRLLQRSFVHRSASQSRLLGHDLPEEADFPAFVAREMQEAGFDPKDTIAWVCPVVWQFPRIFAETGFRACVADIIDDQRSWNIHEGYRKQLDDLYRQTLSVAHVTFANCAPVAANFESYVSNPIRIVPNGAERFDVIADKLSLIEGIAQTGRPTIGYVGNLRDRIDWELLEGLVRMRPEWSFVFAGSAEDNSNIASIAKFANVRFLGVVEYHDLPSFLMSIDVGIVPHIVNDMTNSMNPLKVYNYLAAGVPVVSTAIPNLNELVDLISVANGPEEFAAAIENCLAKASRKVDVESRRDFLDKISWKARVDEILTILRPFLN